jgi:hypothetical protein
MEKLHFAKHLLALSLRRPPVPLQRLLVKAFIRLNKKIKDMKKPSVETPG